MKSITLLLPLVFAFGALAVIVNGVFIAPMALAVGGMVVAQLVETRLAPEAPRHLAPHTVGPPASNVRTIGEAAARSYPHAA